MIIVKVLGGLGNQMFQYAFMRAYEEKNHMPVKLDTGGFSTYKLRQFKLENFDIKATYATEEEVSACINLVKRRGSYLPKFLRKRLKKEKYIITSNIIEPKSESLFDPELFALHDNAYYDGYYQNEQFFEGISDIIRREFTLRTDMDDANIALLKQIRTTQSVSLHVRRGDYVHMQQIFALCDLPYYQHSIDHMARIVSSPHFYIFSNDHEWARANLNLRHAHTFVDINGDDNDHCDLELMRNCRHNIIANSSFSWWAAWLNDNENKTIIAPKNWFSDGRPCSIVPSRWITY